MGSVHERKATMVLNVAGSMSSSAMDEPQISARNTGERAWNRLAAHDEGPDAAPQEAQITNVLIHQNPRILFQIAHF
jgi:hypothetical protein